MARKRGEGTDGGDAGAAAVPAGQFQPFGRRPLRTFGLVIGLPALLLYVGSALLVVLALGAMAHEIDRLEEQRGLTAMHAALGSFLNGLSEVAATQGTWNEAHLNVVVKPDPAWMDATWGTTARFGSVYDDVMVTDQTGLVLFGENNLGPIRGNIAARYPAARAMLEELDAAIAASGDAAVIVHFASDGKAPAGLAAASIHRSTPGEARVPRHNRRILWIARHLTPTLLQDIAVRYQMPLAGIVTDVAPAASAIDLTDAEGKIAGTVAWEPDRPGAAALDRALLVAAGIFLAVGVALALGLRLLRRAMVRRAAAIEAAIADHARPGDPAGATAAAPREDEPADAGRNEVDASDFTLAYQPVFDLRTEAMVGVDVLLRWTRADGTPLLQEELGAADCAALMERAAIMALRQATSELAPYLGIVVGLTVGPGQLQDDVFAEKVAGTLGATGFPARRLQLGVDAELLPEPARFVGAVAALRRAGIAIALGNFTLGPHSFGYLRPGVADRICLSPHMVALVDADPVRLKLVEATIAAARAAAFAVTAPGIERREEAARLLRLGCSEMRGPLLAAPLPIGSLAGLLLAPARPARQAG